MWQGRVWGRCMVYVVVVCSVVCLSVTDWFSRSQHSRPSLEKSHCRVQEPGTPWDKTLHSSSGVRLDTQNVEEMPQMSKSSSSQVRIQVAARFTVLHYLVAPRPWHNLCCTCVRTMRTEFTTQENWINVFSWLLFRPILVSIYNRYLWRAIFCCCCLFG